MVTATLQEAKAKLNSLVEKALAGDLVVLMRGAKIVARIQPLSEDDLELSPSLTDAQAEQFWKEVNEKTTKKARTIPEVISHLKKHK